MAVSLNPRLALGAEAAAAALHPFQVLLEIAAWNQRLAPRAPVAAAAAAALARHPSRALHPAISAAHPVQALLLTAAWNLRLALRAAAAAVGVGVGVATAVAALARHPSQALHPSSPARALVLSVLFLCQVQLPVTGHQALPSAGAPWG